MEPSRARARRRVIVWLRHRLHVRVACRPSRLPLRVRPQHLVVVAVESAGSQQFSGQRLSRRRHLLCPAIVLLGPLDFVQEVRQVPLHGKVVGARFEVAVEKLVIGRVLLQDQAVAQHQVREAIRRHRSIHVHLVLVLQSGVQ